MVRDREIQQQMVLVARDDPNARIEELKVTDSYMQFIESVEARSFKLPNYKCTTMIRISPELLVIDNIGSNVGYLTADSLTLIDSQEYWGDNFLYSGSSLL
jgi:hypothetical protein